MLKKPSQVSIENEAWAKGWPDLNKDKSKLSIQNYSKKFNWIKTWGKNHFIKILKIMIPYIIVLSIIILFIRSKKENF